MSSSDVVVSWIFDRLGVDVALAGDLREERAHSRSTIWFCRQVLIAICIGLPVRPVISYDSIATLLIILLTQVTTGWVVARTHRRYPIPMVFVFVIWLVLWYLGGSSEIKTLMMDSFGKPGFLRYLVWYLTPESVVVVGLLFGASLVPAAKTNASAAKVD